ncbi:hypothetical protein EDB81DRAFT_850255 [Dactylonectria macrodidyma]|uniref:Ubiquitin-like protease family profile domain-containing protein n=1 Tax=Dactylonectria macrodidyma TaxID=307937 RepID=A0A9P9FTS1_9HYPO|nr:hypothetical protein EDB81DRAFT_850255 [Dactylonectria macrodidyma]
MNLQSSTEAKLPAKTAPEPGGDPNASVALVNTADHSGLAGQDQDEQLKDGVFKLPAKVLDGNDATNNGDVCLRTHPGGGNTTNSNSLFLGNDNLGATASAGQPGLLTAPQTPNGNHLDCSMLHESNRLFYSIAGAASAEQHYLLQDTTQHPEAGQVTHHAEVGPSSLATPINEDEQDRLTVTEPRIEDGDQTLFPDTWFSDQVMVRALSLLAGTAPGDVTVIDPSLSGPYSNESIEVAPHMIVLVPIRVNNTHWLLAIFNGSKKWAQVYDSATEPPNAANREMMLRLFARLFPKGNMADWAISEQHTPMHFESNDCGISVIVAAFFYVSWQLLPPLPIHGFLWNSLFSSWLNESSDPVAWVEQEVKGNSLISALETPPTWPDYPVPPPLDNVRYLLQTIANRKPTAENYMDQLNVLRYMVILASSAAVTIQGAASQDGARLQRRVQGLDESITKAPDVSKLIVELTHQRSDLYHGRVNVCHETAGAMRKLQQYTSLVEREIDNVQGRFCGETGSVEGLKEGSGASATTSL